MGSWVIAINGWYYARAINHVETVVGSECQHFYCRGSIIGCIPINQYIKIGIDIGKHAANNIPFAQYAFMPHNSTGFECSAYGIVR
ncbi:hypothetical protein H845_32 [Komagataeibacter xylinus E25]|nr:hypothetical protein H845_32 [Komagataeibacter xylinus E25]